MPYPFDDDENEARAEDDGERERKFITMLMGGRNARPVLGRGGVSEAPPPESAGSTNDELIRHAGGMHGSEMSRPRVPDAPVLGSVPRGWTTPGYDAARREIEDRPPTFANPLPPAPPGASLLGRSSQPEGPATTRYEELLRKGPPQYHGFNKFLDILGQATGFEEQTGLGTLGYQARLGRAAKNAESELNLRKEEETARFSTPEKRQAYMQANPSLFAGVTDFEKNDFILSGKFPQREPTPGKPESVDQEIADAAATAQQEGRDPNSDPKVLQLLDVKQRGQKEPTVKPDTQTVEDQRYEKIKTAQTLKQPVPPEDVAWSQAYEKRKTLGPVATAGLKAGEQGTARGDRSYQWHAGRIDKLREPITSRMERISRLEDTLNQGTPQADALVAPELLSVMAGGQGSGLRMNEAEIARIVGGRTNWESIKAKLNAWQADPNKGFALTPAQREQTRALFAAVKDRVSKKMSVIDEESEALSGTDSAAEHRRIYNRLQKRLSDIDAGTNEKGQVIVTDPNGGHHTFPDQASADRFKKLAKIQ